MNPRGMMVRLVIVVAVSMSIFLITNSLALAEGECKGDIAKYCKGAKGSKQEVECLKEHKEQLSPRCKMHIVQVLQAAKETHQGCEPEIHAFCSGVQPGGGRILKCLKAHKSQLSPVCKEGIADLIMSK